MSNPTKPVRLGIAGCGAATRASTGPGVPMPNPSRLRLEAFPIAFSNELLKQTLGWKPAYDFKAGAEMTRQWLEFARMIPARS